VVERGISGGNKRKIIIFSSTSFMCWYLHMLVGFLLLMLVLLLNFDLLTSSNQLEWQIRIIQIWTQSISINLTIYFLLHLWPSLHNTTHSIKISSQKCVQTTNINTTFVLTETFLSKLIRGRQSKNLYQKTSVVDPADRTRTELSIDQNKTMCFNKTRLN
jgi:hypothetical protein